MNSNCRLQEDPPQVYQLPGWTLGYSKHPVIHMTAIENISIADARRIINSSIPSSSLPGSPDAPHNPDYNN